ncbi:serine/threonine-protein phosphatase 6 regulatory ankyrin repeat subunit B-like [Macrosteles quadrilineatus]|uniref:serine/threonine-protein phosphatase 6 regulatory ankyrin repeat subunit B-like n=1 Tax=Macrosteles quadrilineatus TaxID=74068 RepID=UPI0023E1F365|nr:serine/threonine-protein phosphatase 6 regulatory ankyrin repeat subunit B-like [Macrosteles quadrilineatus]
MAFNADWALFTPLVRAVVDNKPEDVREALNLGFSANFPDGDGWTPVHHAAAEDTRNECLKELLTHKSADINAQTFLDQTPLYVASERNCVKNVKLLLEQKKCNINLGGMGNMTPLHVACCDGNVLIAKQLIEFGAEVNAKDYTNYTPLHAIVDSHTFNRGGDNICYDICKRLLENGCNPDVIDLNGNHPFHLACYNGLFKCAYFLLSVSKQNDLINLKNRDEQTPLMSAVLSRNVPLVEYLLDQGADVNIADSMTDTALHHAATTGDFGLFSLILRETNKECILKYCTFDEGRDFEGLASGKRMNSLICLAINTGNLEFLNQVLKSDLDPAALACPVQKYPFNNSFTLHAPISFLLEFKMCELGNSTLDFLHTLIEHGFPIKVTSKHPLVNYISPICAGLVALDNSPPDIVLKCLKVLLHRNADPDEPHGRMPFAMEQAIKRQNTEAVLLLLQHSNVLEPEDVIHWILLTALDNTSGNQVKIIEALLPLAPYYQPSEQLLPDLTDILKRKELLTQKVYPLTHYCRTVIRKQLHKETESCPTLFRQHLSGLMIPKELYSFLSFI